MWARLELDPDESRFAAEGKSLDSAASQEDSPNSAASTNPNAEKDSTERAILRPLGQEDEEAECPPAGQNGPADGGKEF